SAKAPGRSAGSTAFGYVRVARGEETQLARRPGAGVLDADPPGGGPARRRRSVVGEIEVTAAGQIEAVLLAGDVEPGAELPRSGQRSLEVGHAGDGRRRAQEDGARHAVGLGDDVHAAVHAVDEIDVEESGRAEHDRR